ncbi:hypothetical protein AAG570_012292 [Ranatra chinensis]|uniref:ABC transporter domain-containing protein n=1 Tax=Ranatra chinensis TaxID=642074 RepID=A0ABD0YIE0_9HEMI
MVALNDLDSGSIRLCVKSKSSIGYMSQELGLYTEFSIWETLCYYGWIYGMKKKAIRKRVDELLEFLDLPSKNRVLSQLSGGQQRRVSLCTALLHDPELLILDEPTVGIDPVLSHQ